MAILLQGCNHSALSPGEIRRLPLHHQHVFDVAFTRDGRYALSCGQDRVIQILDARDGKVLRQLAGHEKAVRSAAFSPDGTKVVSGSMDLTVRIWDREIGVETNRFSGHEGEVYAVAYSPDGSSVVSGGTDKTIRLWDTGRGEEKARFTGKLAEVITIHSLAFSPKGTEILAGCEDKTVRLFDLTLQEIRRFEGMPTAVLCVGFSPDGLYTLASGTSNRILVWHCETGEEVQRLTGHRGTVRRAVFLRDHTIFSGSFDRTLVLWDLASGAEFRRFANHADAVYCVAASPDGKTAMTGSYDGSVSFWNLR